MSQQGHIKKLTLLPPPRVPLGRKIVTSSVKTIHFSLHAHSYHLNCLPCKPATFKKCFHSMAPQCSLIYLLPSGWKAPQSLGITTQSSTIHSESTQQDFEDPPFARPCVSWVITLFSIRGWSIEQSHPPDSKWQRLNLGTELLENRVHLGMPPLSLV